jgi:4a-hydroxytetrahydrobiopterin dehydratase
MNIIRVFLLNLTKFIKNEIMTIYNEQTVKALLENFDNWDFENEGIVKKFQFKNFIEAMGFIVKVGLIAEKMNHHPNWSNVYNIVEISLNTHDAGDIVTEKDYELAKAIDKLMAE